ncbi:MAG: hypothetical protein VXZ35_03400, partial [Pseudomonadota bacterium]|nr:hypothetical protein [Pseudomonadota bacterium]
GDDSNTGAKVVAQLADLVNGVNSLAELGQQAGKDTSEAEMIEVRNAVDALTAAVKQSQPSVNVVNEPVPGIDRVLSVLAETIEHSIFPLVRSMDKKLEIDLRTHDKMRDISSQLKKLKTEIRTSDTAKSKPNKGV